MTDAVRTPELVVVPDAHALAVEAALRIERVAVAADWDDPATLALAGGSTPRVAYQHLGSRCVAWAKLRLFFGDERCVPPDDADSNFHMVRNALLERVYMPEKNVHRMRGELPPAEGAAQAQEELRREFPGQAVPRFDLMILGIGTDGHTASLFPEAPELDVADRLCVPVHRPDLPQPWRISMTMPVLNAAHQVMFLASDGAKAEVIARAVAGDPSLPAGRVRPSDGTLTWILTEDAARLVR
ncbi:MAG TPA: 6-phosphogluconolactonase [Miltoncostaeaceae bacterium]|nr:6-phosphogluconolactonase [Miltoncostaeaceae bacterium]